MAECIIDTNVPIAANNRPHPDSKISLACALAALERLVDVQQNGCLVLDDQFRILNEYERHLNSSGQPGPGDQFYQWALQSMYNQQGCHLVRLDEPAPFDFTIFPTAPALAKFDRSDRKFVALCLSHPAHPPIVVAGDRGWQRHATALQSHGVEVEFLCPNDTTYSRK